MRRGATKAPGWPGCRCGKPHLLVAVASGQPDGAHRLGADDDERTRPSAGHHRLRRQEPVRRQSGMRAGRRKVRANGQRDRAGTPGRIHTRQRQQERCPGRAGDLDGGAAARSQDGCGQERSAAGGAGTASHAAAVGFTVGPSSYNAPLALATVGSARICRLYSIPYHMEPPPT